MSGSSSIAEIQADFADALRSAGLRIQGPPAMDGRLRRVDVEGDRNGRKSGAYIGHLDGIPAGHIVNHKTGFSQSWRSERAVNQMSPQEQARIRAEAERVRTTKERERTERRQLEAERAQATWEKAAPVSSHPYLTAKQVDGTGLRVKDGLLLVPMRDVDGRLWNIQTIGDDGMKLFQSGARVTAMHLTLGQPRNGHPIIIAEGYATAATIREAMGLPTVAAFNSGNMVQVATALRDRYPDSALILSGDDDRHLLQRNPPIPNAGRDKAEEAARTANGVAVFPPFGKDERGSDFNDYARAHGIDAVYDAIAPVLRERGHPVLSRDARIIMAALAEEIERQLPSLSSDARREILRAAVQQVSHREATDGPVELTPAQRERARDREGFQARYDRAVEWTKVQREALAEAQTREAFLAIIRGDDFERGRERLAAHYPSISYDLEAAIREARARTGREQQQERREERDEERQRQQIAASQQR